MPRPQKNVTLFLWLSPAMVAAACGLSTAVVRQAINDGKLTVRKIGMKRRISVANIAEWYETLEKIEPKRKSS
jgi:Helix-turn-helix domain